MVDVLGVCSVRSAKGNKLNFLKANTHYSKET